MRAWCVLIIMAIAVSIPDVAEAKYLVELNYKVPPRYHLRGVKRIAVVPFSYTMTYHELGSRYIPKMFAYEMKKSGIFDVVEPKVRGLSLDDEYSLKELLAIGRSNRVDAIIGGKIRGFQYCDYYTCEKMLGAAEVSFCVELTNVARGKVTDRICYYQQGKEVLRAVGDISDLSREERMVLGTAKKLISRIISEMSPKDVTIEVKLMGDKECKAGVKAAMAGDWGSAVDTWKEVISGGDVKCAYYNLGVADEKEGKFAEALANYKKALSLDNGDKLCSEGVKRMEEMKRRMED